MADVEANVAALELERVLPKIRTVFERDDKFYANIKKQDVESISNQPDARSTGIKARWLIRIFWC